MASKLIDIRCIGLEPIFSHTEKSCVASYYRQFSIKIKIKTSLSAQAFWPFGSNKTGLNFLYFILFQITIISFEIVFFQQNFFVWNESFQLLFWYFYHLCLNK